MTGRELSECLNYTGMERAVRQLALHDKLAPEKELAIMSELEVCDLVAEKYVMLSARADEVWLVKKDELPTLAKSLKRIAR